jgi:hypothetical protein
MKRLYKLLISTFFITAFGLGNQNHIEQLSSSKMLNREVDKQEMIRITNDYPQPYRSLNRDNFFSVLIDSSKNGYGMYFPATTPISYNFNSGYAMTYRKWQGINESSGYLGVANSPIGAEWLTSYPINENLPDGTPMATARYPSIVTGSDGTSFAVWNEYTEPCSGGGSNCGRIFFNFNQDTWFIDYPNDDMLDLNNGCATTPCFPEDLWQVQPVLIDDNQYWYLYTISVSWTDNNLYFIKTTIEKATGTHTNTDPEIITFPSNYHLFKMNDDGFSSITKTSGGFQYSVSSDFGENWTESLTIPADTLTNRLADIGFNNISVLNYFDNHEAHIDNNGGLHVFTGLNLQSDTDDTTCYFHFYNSTPENVNAWIINYVTDITQSYQYSFGESGSGQSSSEFLFPAISFSYENDNIIWFLCNKVSIIDANGDYTDLDIYLYKSENLGVSWIDFGNITNTNSDNQIETYIHAADNSTNNSIGFMYQIPDLDVNTLGGNFYADFKQLVYFGFYGDFVAGSENLVINEIMQNPSAVADDSGEWFEIYNAGEYMISLQGYSIKDAGTDMHTIEDIILLYPGSFIVLGNNAVSNTNGGLTIDYQYSGISLGNGSDELIILDPDGMVIDSVGWDNGATFPDPTNGASMALSDPTLDNSLGSNWQESTTPYGDGDLGTPGIPNFSSDIALDLTSLDFDTVNVSESGTLDLTISNAGNGSLHVDSLYTTSSLFTLSFTDSVIENSAILSVSFSPIGFGPATATLYIESNDPDESMVEVSLTGFGYYPSPDIELDSTSIDFGGVMDGLAGVELLHVYNIGETALEIDTVYCTSNFSVMPNSGTVDAGDTLRLEVMFSPNDETSFDGTMTIVAGNDPDEDTLTVSLSGTGTQQAPIMELSDDSLYFGVVVAGQTVTRQTTIYNMGMLDLEVEELNMAGSELFTTDFSDATVEPGDSVDVMFQFAPTEQITEATATAIVVGSGVADQTITLYAGEVLTAENDFIPSQYILYQNHPNPFNPVTTLQYDLPENSYVNVTVYDMLGREVRTLVNTTQDAGFKSVIWDATNDYGKPVSAGVYLYKIQTGEFVQTKKMVLLR